MSKAAIIDLVVGPVLLIFVGLAVAHFGSTGSAIEIVAIISLVWMFTIGIGQSRGSRAPRVDLDAEAHATSGAYRARDYLVPPRISQLADKCAHHAVEVENKDISVSNC